MDDGQTIDRSEAIAALRSVRFSEHPPIEGVDGVLHYRLYDQDGEFVAMTCRDTPELRKFVEWTRMFDRYSSKRINEAKPQPPSEPEQNNPHTSR